MTTDLHKRLEEAADKYADGWRNCVSAGNGFLAGAEHGYKEAIEVAKELLLEQGKIDTLDAVELDMQMNKLWEEKK